MDQARRLKLSGVAFTIFWIGGWAFRGLLNLPVKWDAS